MDSFEAGAAERCEDGNLLAASAATRGCTLLWKTPPSQQMQVQVLSGERQITTTRKPCVPGALGSNWAWTPVSLQNCQHHAQSAREWETLVRHSGCFSTMPITVTGLRPNAFWGTHTEENQFGLTGSDDCLIFELGHREKEVTESRNSVGAATYPTDALFPVQTLCCLSCNTFSCILTEYK